MPAPFPINTVAIPLVPTRKALLILDLQNEFVSPDGALYTQEPEGYIGRILELARVFRDTGAGDVVWVRSEFERHCSLLDDGEQIITADAMLRPKKTPTRGRQPSSAVHEGAVMEEDEEAFLSVSANKDKKPCVRKETPGADFAPLVKAAVVAGRDIVFTKSHYSAFASGQQQLVQLLRGRFVTQMYVCGALTNISIYATALGAGQHGYDVTLVEDCCGFRGAIRHLNALKQLEHLTGCEVLSSETLLEQLQPAAPASRSTGLSPSMSKISLDLSGGPPGRFPAAGRRAITPEATSPQPGRRTASNQSKPEAGTTRPANDTVPLEADSDPSSSESESTHSREKNPKEQDGNTSPPIAKSESESSKGPIPSPPGASSAEAETPSLMNRVEQSCVQHSSSEEEPPVSSLSQTVAIQSRLPPDAAEPDAKGPGDIAAPALKIEPDSTPTMADQQPPPTCAEPLCEGDTSVITNVLPPALAADAFERLLEEVSWAGMSHMGGEVPRRIAVQGEVAVDGSMPVYRHPADESPPLLPFSPTVLQIKKEVEKHLGHPLNHVLIQHYRSGNDYISEHSDKTLDIVRGSFIANVSLGAERTMIFRTKRPPREKATNNNTNTSFPLSKPDVPLATTTTTTTPPSPTSTPTHPASDSPNPPNPDPNPNPAANPDAESKRQTQRAPLPHNSLLRMGLATNARWLHAIRQDRRADRDKSPRELACSGARISLTFRRIGTFIDASQGRIWGQGATVKTKAKSKTMGEGEGGEGEGGGMGDEGGYGKEVVNGQTEEAVRMLRAFGAENNKSVFEWEEWYGGGFDVLHMGVPKRVFFASSSSGGGGGSGDGLGNVCVALALAEMGVGCAKGSVEGLEVRFEDNDPGRAVVEGRGAVLRYLDAVYGAGRRYDQMLPAEVARRFVRLQRGLDLWGKWKAVLEEAGVRAAGEERASKEEVRAVGKLLGKELVDWETWAGEAASSPTAASGDGTKVGGTGSSFYIGGGSQPSSADFAFWPVLHDMVRVCGEQLLGENLRRYFATFKERSSVAKALGQLIEMIIEKIRYIVLYEATRADPKQYPIPRSRSQAEGGLPKFLAEGVIRKIYRIQNINNNIGLSRLPSGPGNTWHRHSDRHVRILDLAARRARPPTIESSLSHTGSAASAEMTRQLDKAEILRRLNSFTGTPAPPPQARRPPGLLKLGPHYRALSQPAKPIRFRFGTRTVHASAASVDGVHKNVLCLQVQPSLSQQLLLLLTGLLLPTAVRAWFEASFPEWTLPRCLILKQQKEGWDDEFEAESVVIPRYLGEVTYQSKRAILLSDIGGAAMATPEGLLLEMPDLRRMMQQAVGAIGRLGRVHDDPKLDNYHVVGDRIMIVDLERMSEHVADPEQLDLLVRSEVDHVARRYEQTQYRKWKQGIIAVDANE
ncbi:hypothetical protein N658DRAFT_488457 [Parathielavia hyrcaniae]|uniref:Fe2OG dioxygenase domain-containing protein n=1 Tax=Parathielavia hyrcaniae TaxID=113614 RepID=A0AAN6PUV1_9PEZI|nr:hypothetical protein N658DRAFT_488457 [Parathielavia hyrcaniae]